MADNGREILQDIIKDFTPEKPVPEIFNRGFVRFFREKNRSFAPRKEDLNQYDDNNFRNGIKLGEIKNVGAKNFSPLRICAFEVVGPNNYLPTLSEGQSGKGNGK